MTDNNKLDSFHQTIADSPELKARFDLACAQVRADAAEIGLNPGVSEIAGMDCVRLAVWANDKDGLQGEAYEKALQKLPSAIAVRKRNAEIEAIKGGDAKAAERLRNMRPADRLTYSRNMPESDPANIYAGGGADAEQAALSRIMSLKDPSTRISEWRKYQATQR